MTRKIVVTGASSEIGRAIARKLIMPGDTAVLHCRNRVKECEALQRELGEGCTVVPADLAVKEAREIFCSQLQDTDILVNAAACTFADTLIGLDEDKIMAMIQVNIVALVSVCKAVVPAMTAKRSGCIINISSVTASRGNRGQTVYAGTKGFVESFTRSLAAEYGAKGIRVNCIAPGPINAGSAKEILAYAPEEVRQSVALQKLGKPEDIASLAAFLASGEGNFITGQCIHVDGGFLKGV